MADQKDEAPREVIARILRREVSEERLTKLITSAFELVQGTYSAEGPCPHCGKPRKVYVRIPDIKGTVATLTEWIEQGFGRPGTASAESGDVVLIVERWDRADNQNSDELPASSETETLQPIAG